MSWEERMAAYRTRQEERDQGISLARQNRLDTVCQLQEQTLTTACGILDTLKAREALVGAYESVSGKPGSGEDKVEEVTERELAFGNMGSVLWGRSSNSIGLEIRNHIPQIDYSNIGGWTQGEGYLKITRKEIQFGVNVVMPSIDTSFGQPRLGDVPYIVAIYDTGSPSTYEEKSLPPPIVVKDVLTQADNLVHGMYKLSHLINRGPICHEEYFAYNPSDVDAMKIRFDDLIFKMGETKRETNNLYSGLWSVLEEIRRGLYPFWDDKEKMDIISGNNLVALAAWAEKLYLEPRRSRFALPWRK